MKKEGVIPNAETCPQFVTKVPNTLVFVSPENVEQLRPVVNRTLGFVEKTSREVGETYVDGLNKYRTLQNGIPYNILTPLITSRNLHLPEFEIHDGTSSRVLLESAGYPQESIAPNGVLLVFRIPRLSALIWKRLDEANGRKAIAKNVWARLGYEARDTYLEIYDQYNETSPLSLRIINGIGHHDADRFYYLQEITRPQRVKGKRKKAA